MHKRVVAVFPHLLPVIKSTRRLSEGEGRQSVVKDLDEGTERQEVNGNSAALSQKILGRVASVTQQKLGLRSQ